MQTDLTHRSVVVIREPVSVGVPGRRPYGRRPSVRPSVRALVVVIGRTRFNQVPLISRH